MSDVTPYIPARQYIRFQCRYEDHFDAVTTLLVSKEKTDKKSITDYGSYSAFLTDRSGDLLGQ